MPGVPSRVSGGRRFAARISMRSAIVPCVVGPERPGRARVGRRHVGALGPLALPRELAPSERREHGEDLLAADVREHAGLTGGVTADDLAHLELDDGRRTRELEELRGRPHGAAAGDVLEDRERRAESAAAEERAEPGAQRAHDGKAPRVAVLAVVLEAVEGECVHADAGMLGAAVACRPGARGRRARRCARRGP